ncbi:MAG TPA: hypothetical protein VGO34_08435 [Alphaproteobacteria bacterium]
MSHCSYSPTSSTRHKGVCPKKEIAEVIAKLSNEAFVSKAPPEIIEENRERQASFEAAKAKLAEALARLSAA